MAPDELASRVSADQEPRTLGPQCQNGPSPQLQCLRLIAAPIWPAAGCSQMPAASLVARRLNFDEADQYSSSDGESSYSKRKTSCFPSEAGISHFDWRSPRHSIKYASTAATARERTAGTPSEATTKKDEMPTARIFIRQQEKGPREAASGWPFVR
jgi:hypothetical protein